MKTADELWELLQQARQMPYGAAQIATVEQVLRHADTVGDPALAFTARLIATDAYMYGGEKVKSFVTFSWCVSDFDRNPQPYHERRMHTLLWQFKATVSSLDEFPEVPLDRTHAVLEDMERRYRESGHGMQAVYKRRYLVANHVGKKDEADEWYDRWQAAPRDSLSDCAGCDPTTAASYLNSRGRYAEVVALAEPVLAGELTCNEQPQGILRELAVAWLQTGEHQKAADAHRRAYMLERPNLADLWNIGSHIGFCARTGNESRGLEMLQRHIDWLEKAPSPAAEMNFAADGALLLRRLTEQGHGDLKIRIRDRGEVTAADLATELADRATTLAARFDARNGTDHQSRLIADEINAQPYGVDLVLSPVARPAAPKPVEPEPVAEEPLPEIPSTLGPSELLDLADHYNREERPEALAATLREFDARFGDVTDARVAGRRLELASSQLYDEDPTDTDGMIDLLERAAVKFTEAGPDAAGDLVVTRARVALIRAEAGGEVDDQPVLAEVAYQDEHGDTVGRATAYNRLTNIRCVQDRFDEAIEAVEHAYELAKETGEPRRVAFVALLRARALAGAHRHGEAQAAAKEAWEFFDVNGPRDRRAGVAFIYAQLSHDNPELQVRLFGTHLAIEGADLSSHVGRARALLRLDRPAEAVPDFQEAVAICDEQDAGPGSAFSRQELAQAYKAADRAAEAVEVAEEALLRFERLGYDRPADDVRFMLAGLYRQLKDNQAAVDAYRDLVSRLGDNPAGRGQVGEQFAGLLYDMDQDANAADAFRAAAADLREAGDLVGELRALRRRVGALHYADQPEAGEETVRLVAERFAALPPEVAAEPNAIWQFSMTAFETGRLRMSRGRYAEALPVLRDAVDRLNGLGATDDADRLVGMLGEALLRAGHPAEAEAMLRELLKRLPGDDPGRSIAEDVHAEAVEALRDQG